MRGPRGKSARYLACCASLCACRLHVAPQYRRGGFPFVRMNVTPQAGQVAVRGEGGGRGCMHPAGIINGS